MKISQFLFLETSRPEKNKLRSLPFPFFRRLFLLPLLTEKNGNISR